MGMGYGMGNPRSQVDRRKERLAARYAQPQPAPVEPKRLGRPKGSKNKQKGAADGF